jgi:hypothetical protein
MIGLCDEGDTDFHALPGVEVFVEVAENCSRFPIPTARAVPSATESAVFTPSIVFEPS